MSKKSYIIPIFIPHKGCPHDCSFCNQKKIAGEADNNNEENVISVINRYMELYPKNAHNLEIAFYGGSFTGLPIHKQIELLTPAYEIKKAGYVKEIRISTRPDYINENILSLLEEYGVSIIELGVQSTDDYVLHQNKRGHTKKDVFKAVELVRKYNFQLGLQMMIGLFGDSRTTIEKTAEDIVLLKPDFLRIYPTIVIKDTYLETLYLNGEYVPFSLEETVEICKKLLLQFKDHSIPVIRLGLQSTEDITYGKAIVAGPYHPAFREIVESSIYRDLIENELIKYNVNESKQLVIYCHPTSASKVAGYKQKNKSYLISKYSFSKITIKPSYDIKKDSVKLEVDK